MIPAASLDALRSAVGRDAVITHDEIRVDGVGLDTTVRPADGEALAAALATLSRCGHGALLRGGGSRMGLGNPPTRAQVVLSTQGLLGVDELDADEGVCHARAGTPLSTLRAAAAARGWELPLDAPGANSTLGGALACAALGPRAQGYGPPRDAVLGLEVALASGERTRCGGRVVKNVTGYDLNKLYTGSLGSLGVIEGAWLRLRPAPARTAAFEGEVTLSRDGFQRSLSAARRATTRAAALVRRGGAPGLRLSVELGGHAAAVERDAGWLVQELGLAAAPEGALDRVRALQGELPGPGGLRLRLAARPSRLWPALERLASGGAALLAYPGLGLLYVGFELAAGEDAAGAIESVAQRAREAAGSWMIEAAPAGAKAGRDVFGDPTQALALTRSLKQQFDPDGLLNAGRFAGHV